MKRIVKNPEPPVFIEWKANWPDMTPVEFNHCIDALLKPQSGGTFKPYWTTIKYAAGWYDQ